MTSNVSLRFHLLLLAEIYRFKLYVVCFPVIPIDLCNLLAFVFNDLRDVSVRIDRVVSFPSFTNLLLDVILHFKFLLMLMLMMMLVIVLSLIALWLRRQSIRATIWLWRQHLVILRCFKHSYILLTFYLGFECLHTLLQGLWLYL